MIEKSVFSSTIFSFVLTKIKFDTDKVTPSLFASTKTSYASVAVQLDIKSIENELPSTSLSRAIL